MKHPSRNTASEPQTASLETGIATPLQHADELDFVVPVVREEVQVHKTSRTTGAVRIEKLVREFEEVVSEDLAVETVEFERVPKNEIVDIAPSVRTEGDVTIIPVVKEELVVTKQIRLIEELRVTRRHSVVDFQQTVPLLAEEVVIKRHTSAE